MASAVSFLCEFGLSQAKERSRGPFIPILARLNEKWRHGFEDGNYLLLICGTADAADLLENSRPFKRIKTRAINRSAVRQGNDLRGLDGIYVLQKQAQSIVGELAPEIAKYIHLGPHRGVGAVHHAAEQPVGPGCDRPLRRRKELEDLREDPGRDQSENALLRAPRSRWTPWSPAADARDSASALRRFLTRQAFHGVVEAVRDR